jgi:hypothetical protein
MVAVSAVSIMHHIGIVGSYVFPLDAFSASVPITVPSVNRLSKKSAKKTKPHVAESAAPGIDIFALLCTLFIRSCLL